MICAGKSAVPVPIVGFIKFPAAFLPEIQCVAQLVRIEFGPIAARGKGGFNGHGVAVKLTAADDRRILGIAEIYGIDEEHKHGGSGSRQGKQIIDFLLRIDTQQGGIIDGDGRIEADVDARRGRISHPSRFHWW